MSIASQIIKLIIKQTDVFIKGNKGKNRIGIFNEKNNFGDENGFRSKIA